MKNDFVCVFDADGTLYNKEVPLTFEMRKRVISLISQINGWSFNVAEKKYYGLKNDYPNPYLGVMSLGITPDMYQNIYNELPVEEYIQKDSHLISLIRLLSELSEIQVLSFAPEPYLYRLLDALGIREYISIICCAGAQCEFKKGNYYTSLRQNKQNDCIFIAIGDDFENDIAPAQLADYLTYHVDFKQEKTSIVNVVANIIKTLKSMPIPPIMRVETSSICNEKCTFCPYSTLKRKHGKMDFKLFEKIVEEHSTFAPKARILFPASIGEPFLDNDFPKYIKHASNFYTKISTFSNGSVLNENTIEQYISAGGTELMLTLHGYNEKDHKNITQTSSYRNTRENIQNVARINNARGNPLNIILDLYVYDEPATNDSYLENLRSLGVLVNVCAMNRAHNWGGKVNQANIVRQTGCRRIYDQFGVQFDGTVVPCCIDTEGDYVLGNSSKQTLQEIFSSPSYIKLVAFEKSRLLKEVSLCQYCNIN